MQLIDINKEIYRKHLNIIIIGFIASLLVFSLGLGALFIHLFSSVGEYVTSINDIAENAPKESNFKYNLAGVILALLANAAILHSIKDREFFTEVYYVWQIKQLQNLIYRKLAKVKSLAEQGSHEAIVVLVFYYQSQKQIYQLDDNTITLSTVVKSIEKTEVLADNFDVSIVEIDIDKNKITAL